MVSPARASASFGGSGTQVSLRKTSDDDRYLDAEQQRRDWDAHPPGGRTEHGAIA